MEDFIKRNIDMIGQMLLALAERLGLTKPYVPEYTMKMVQDEIKKNGFDIDTDRILSEEHPVAYLVETLHFSNEALETMVEIIMHSDADEKAKNRVLMAAINYMDGTGYYSFSLHSLV